RGAVVRSVIAFGCERPPAVLDRGVVCSVRAAALPRRIEGVDIAAGGLLIVYSLEAREKRFAVLAARAERDFVNPVVDVGDERSTFFRGSFVPLAKSIRANPSAAVHQAEQPPAVSDRVQGGLRRRRLPLGPRGDGGQKYRHQQDEF